MYKLIYNEVMNKKLNAKTMKNRKKVYLKKIYSRVKVEVKEKEFPKIFMYIKVLKKMKK